MVWMGLCKKNRSFEGGKISFFWFETKYFNGFVNGRRGEELILDYVLFSIFFACLRF